MSMQTPPNLGRQTEEAVILACQCQSTRFSEEKRTARAVVFTCAGCGMKTSVQGRVALARIATDEATFAVHQKVIAPDPDAEPTKKKPSPGEQGFEYIRGKLTSGPDGQASVVRRACEYVRIMNCDDPSFRQQQWLGAALALICADFIAGVDPRVARVYEAQQEAIEEAIARAEANGRRLSRKRVTAVGNLVRDAVAEQLGLVQRRAEASLETTDDALAVAQVNEERAAEQAAKESEREQDSRLLEEGQLMDALVNMRSQCVAQGLVQPNRIVLGGPESYAEFLRTYEKRGGYLFRVEGDERTRTKAGVRPCMYVWMDQDYSECIDLPLNYEEQFEDADLLEPTVEVVELVPANVPDEEMWEQPTFASRREVVR